MNTPPLTIDVVRTSADFAALRLVWNKLLESSPSCSVCLTWDWLFTWWGNYETNEFELHILLLYDGDRLVGIAPFMRQTCRHGYLFEIRVLRFLGTGEPEWEGVVSEYLDVIALDGEQYRVANAVWSYLRKSRQWDQILFNDVLAQSLVLTELRSLVNTDHLSTQLELVGLRFSVDLPSNVSAYAELLDASVAKRIAYKRRKLNRAGLVSVSRVTAQNELEYAFSELVRLHTLRWAREGKKGAFASGRFASFHRQLAKALLPLGMLSIEFLSLNGTNIAILYNLRYRGTEYFYQGGFDINNAGKYSPGLIAHVSAIEAAIHSGLSRYDFMRGDPDSYKAEFGCVKADMHDMTIFGTTAMGTLLATINLFILALRRFKRFLFRISDRHTVPVARSSADC